GKTMHHHAKEGLGSILPFILQAHAARAANIDVIEGAGHGIKAGRIDDDIERIRRVRRLKSAFGNALQRCLLKIDEEHIVAVIGLEIIALERHALYAKAMILRDQLLGGHRILDAAANALGDIFRKFRIRLFIHENLTEIAEPDAEARFLVEPVPERDALLAWHVIEGALVDTVDKAAGRAAAQIEDLVIATPDNGACRLLSLSCV